MECFVAHIDCHPKRPDIGLRSVFGAVLEEFRGPIMRGAFTTPIGMGYGLSGGVHPCTPEVAYHCGAIQPNQHIFLSSF